MENCKFCGKTMYLDDRNTLDRKRYIESYHCGYCGAYYDKTIGQKKMVVHEFWSNPNDRNYKQFLDVIEEFINLVNSISEDEKNELKDKIKKVKDFKELITMLKDSNLSYNEQEIELAKKICLKILEENPNYGKKTKHVLSGIVKSQIPIKEMVQRIILYLCTHDISK